MKHLLSILISSLFLAGFALKISAAEIEKAGKSKQEGTAEGSPTHRSLKLQGLHAYANRESVPAGGTIDFHVSSRIPYQLRVVKLGTEVDDRSGDEIIHAPDKGFGPQVQPIHPGSYVKFSKSLPANEVLNSLTVEAWVRPWKLEGWQGILTQHDYPTDCGFGLFLDGAGKPVFSIGSGDEFDREASITSTAPLKLRQWHHVTGTWDGKQARLFVDGKEVGEWIAPEEAEPRRAGKADLRLGAYADKGVVSHFFDGDLSTPAIYNEALNAESVVARYEARGLKAFSDAEAIASWPLDEERGNRITDTSGNGFDGEIVNLGTWMIGGPSFDGTSVSRYDIDYDPENDPNRGHGLRLAADDLFDCGWDSNHSVHIPKEAKSGIYVAFFDFEIDETAHQYPVTFIVNKAPDAKKAPIALMCSTATWRAYNGTPFAENDPNPLPYYSTGGSKENDPSNPPVYNFYRDHQSGQPSYQVGLRLPWPVAGPGALYTDPKIGYSHLMRGENFTHVWLEKQGYDFDVITNLDLHRDPHLLDGYATLIINGHDEYWSREMYEGLDRYLKNGGTTAVLSGNTMFWRISVDDELGVIECRKFGPRIGGRKFATVGEIFHSHDGKRGSLMRNCGMPPWKTIGLECSGWWGGANNGVYTVNEKATDHFLFQTPEEIDFSDRASFGSSADGQRKACGHEGDIRLSSYVTPKTIPEGVSFPDEPPGIKTLASLKRKDARVLDYFAEFEEQEDATLVDMIYWERPEGGEIFNAGAIAFGWPLDVDPKHTKLFRNVLFHLTGVKAKTPYDPDWKKEEEPKLAKPSDEDTVAPRTIVPETDHALILRAADATLDGKSVQVNPTHGALAWWRSFKDSATWTVQGAKPGNYIVVLDYAVPKDLAGQEFTIKAGDSELKEKTESTGGWRKWSTRKVGEITISKSDLDLVFSPSGVVKGEDFLDLRTIQLIPPGSPRLEKLQAGAAAEVVPPKFPAKPIAGNQPAPVSPGIDGVFTLTGKTATLRGETMELISAAGEDPAETAIAGWSKAGEQADWQLRGIEPGRYDILVDWAMPRVPGGVQRAQLLLDGVRRFSGKVRATEGVDQFASYVIGTVELTGGDHTVSFGPAGVAETWVRLRSLSLVPAAAEGDFQIPDLSVPEGFTIEPAAITPLVEYPMMACLDDRGRMFVAESAGTNAKAEELFETRPHKILMLEDEDDDGVFDKSTVFAENLVLPNGAEWHDGSLYVCSPPYIWKFTDTDDDGVADEQVPVSGKFGFNGMSSAFHGPVLGPDGRMYYCGGQHGWKLGDTSPGLDLDPESWMTSRGPGVFSVWPNGEDPRNRAQGGLANPVEVTFSPEGEVFGTVAVYEDLNGRTDALLHWIHGTIYNLKRRGPPVHPHTSRNNLPPMSRRGWVAPPGLCRYRSGDFANGFGSDYQNDIFMAEFNTHRVYRIKPERKGASYVTTDEIFLESTNPFTHFTDVFEDADGSLLVVDTGGWFLYGCPTSAIERPEIKGAIYRIRKAESQPFPDPRGKQLDWKNPQVEWLDDHRFAVRDRAKTELAKQGEAIIPGLKNVLTDLGSSDRFQRAAIWTLTRINEKTAREVVANAFSAREGSPSVRQTAARSLNASLSRLKDRKLIGEIAATAGATVLDTEEPSSLVREAATLLGRLKTGKSSTAHLMDAVERNAGRDPYLDHSIIYALIELDHVGDMPGFLTHESPHVQRAALIASAEMTSSNLTAEQLAPHLAADDPDLRAEALRLAIARPEWGSSFVGYLENALGAESVSPEIAEALLAFSANPEVQQLVADGLDRETTFPISLDVIQRARLEETPEVWKASLREKLDESLTKPLIESAGSRSDFDYDWKAIANDPAIPDPARLAALEIATGKGGTVSVESFNLLANQLEQKATATPLRIQAATILSRVRLNKKQKIHCAKLTAGAGPLEIGLLLEAFEKEADSGVLETLAISLSESPALFSLPSARLAGILGNHEAGQSLIRKIGDSEDARDTRLDELSSAIAKHKGDPVAGKAAFEKATCAVCHKAMGEGGNIGPELTTIGAIRSERDLLEAIAFPSATFAREYEPTTVTLKDGTMKFGRMGNETDHDFDLIDAQGNSEKIPHNQVVNREMGSISMMPPGLERILTESELSNLIAYLKSLQ